MVPSGSTRVLDYGLNPPMSSESTALGAFLRRCRERSGLTVEGVSTGSRIVPRLVRALESDRHDLLPAPVYVRGFIRAYCDQVGADAEEAVRIYDAQAVPAPPVTIGSAPLLPRLSPPAPPWRRVAAGALVVAALGVVATLLLGRRQPDAVADRGAGATMTASRPVAPAAPAPLAVPTTPAASAPVERVLLMRALDTTWVRVAPDGVQPTEETLPPGTVREWRSAGRFHVTIGNAGGVELELDGHALPTLGRPGQVVRDATIPGAPRP